MIARQFTPAQLAEQAGHSIGADMLNKVLNSTSQAEAVTFVGAALNDAFNPDNDAAISSCASGFAVAIVNVLERGLAAIRAG